MARKLNDDQQAAVRASLYFFLRLCHEQRVRIRKELRDVRLGLDQNISRLGNWMKFINIVLAPVIFAVLTVLIGLFLRRRRRQGQNP